MVCYYCMDVVIVDVDRRMSSVSVVYPSGLISAGTVRTLLLLRFSQSTAPVGVRRFLNASSIV